MPIKATVMTSAPATATAAPTPAPAAAAPDKPARTVVKRPKAVSPTVVDVETTVVTTDTPVAGVTVESINTVATAKAAPAPAPKPAAAPAPAPKPSRYPQGWEAAANGAPACAETEASFVEGWNACIAAGKYGTKETIQTTTTAPAPVAEPPVEETAQEEAPEAPAQTQAVIRRPNQSVGRTLGDGVCIVGEWKQDDMKIPRLQLVQGSGKLAQSFNDGTLLFDQQELLNPPNMKDKDVTPLRFVPLIIQKQYRERLSKAEQDAGAIPRVFDTEAEVREVQGTTYWPRGQKESPPGYFGASAKCLLLIEQPTVEPGFSHPAFTVELDGKFYSMGIYYAGGGAWYGAGSPLFEGVCKYCMVPVLDENGKPKTDERGRIVKTPMPWKNFWQITWARKESNGNIPWRPSAVLLAKEQTGEQLRSFCDDFVFGGTASAALEKADDAD